MAEYVVHDTSLLAVAAAIRAKSGQSGALVFPGGFVQAVEGIAAGGGASLPAAAGVTFGMENGAPAEREQAYAVASDALNALGAVVQSVSGKAEPVTVEEMIYWLDRAKFIPQGSARSGNDMGWRTASAAEGRALEA